MGDEQKPGAHAHARFDPDQLVADAARRARVEGFPAQGPAQAFGVNPLHGLPPGDQGDRIPHISADDPFVADEEGLLHAVIQPDIHPFQPGNGQQSDVGDRLIQTEAEGGEDQDGGRLVAEGVPEGQFQVGLVFIARVALNGYPIPTECLYRHLRE